MDIDYDPGMILSGFSLRLKYLELDLLTPRWDSHRLPLADDKKR